jgi:hypothetical protein
LEGNGRMGSREERGVDPGEPKGMRTVPSQLTIVKSGYPCRIPPPTPPNGPSPQVDAPQKPQGGNMIRG